MGLPRPGPDFARRVVDMDHGRRRIVQAAALAPLAIALAACGGSDSASDLALPEVTAASRGLWMPAEEEQHDATWMCFPTRGDVWGPYLRDVQETIASIALAIAPYEPVRMLARPEDHGLLRDLAGSDIELIEGPVDDLWARDTLPLFLVNEAGDLSAGRVRFNGWGDKQVHDGDTTLASLVAEIVGIELIESGLVGEGGGLETDGAGTLLAARSSWINDNRNPGLDEAEISAALEATLGAERVLWVDGVAGQDITDGHIDTLARFTDPSTIIHEFPSYVEPGETWYDLAADTAAALGDLRTLDGEPYDLVRLTQPSTTRDDSPDFLGSYVNYYVCNGAVILPEFGDVEADAAAAETIGELLPGRDIITIDIDPVAAGGGGIHCATQQQPAR